MKNRLFLLLIFSAVLLMGAGCENKIDSLSPPILKPTTNQNVGKDTTISGTGYPNATLQIFTNGEYKNDLPIDTTGNFSGLISFQKEGENVITTRQTLQAITSEESDALKITVDITPPKPDIKINSIVPEKTNLTEINIKGLVASNTYILFNSDKIISDKNGLFVYIYKLNEGDNKLDIRLEDDVGNQTEIIKTYNIQVDVTPPKINTSRFEFGNTQLTEREEYVHVTYGEWKGWGNSANVPITGNVVGKFKLITVDGKLIKPDENNEIYARLWLSTPYGLNKYKVVVEDLFGNRSSAYLEMNVVDLSNTSNDNDNNYDGCCKYCSTGKACGNSCISRNYTCHQPPGCACDI